VQVLDRAGWFSDLDHKRTAIDKALPTIRAATDPITRSLYVARLSEASRVPEATLWREVAGDVPAAAPAPAPLDPSPAPTRAVRAGRQLGANVERTLVAMVLVARSLLDRVAEQVDVAMLRDANCRAIFEALLRVGPDATVDELASMLTPEAIALLQTMLAEGTMGGDPARVVSDSIAHLRVRAFDEQLEAIQRLLEIAGASEMNGLLTEKMRIMAEIRALKGRGYSKYGKSRRRVDH
jgi:hypothetical protein